MTDTDIQDLIKKRGKYASLPAREYWRARDQYAPPKYATVRFTAQLPTVAPEPPDYRHDERSGYCLDEEWNDPNVLHIQGYSERSR